MNDLERLAAETRELLRQGGLDPHKATFQWWTRREETKGKLRDHAYVDPERVEFHYSKKLAGLDASHRRAVIAHEVGHVLAWVHWNDPSEAAADRAAKTFLGVSIAYDPAYGGKGLQMTKNPLDPDDEIDRDYMTWRRAKDARVAKVLMMIEFSPAIRGMVAGQPRMGIVSGEVSDRLSGEYRVTFFGEDGPHGHNTRPTMRAIAEEIVESIGEPYESMGDDEVIAWTSTPAFELGSRLVAYTQAENMFRYLASRAGKIDWAYEVIREVNDSVGPRPHTPEVIEGATEKIVAAMRTLPAQNPPPSGFVANPPWVTGALAGSYEQLEKLTPAAWMPALSSVSARGGRLTAKLTEFGCGAYGCVMPTLDPKVVLKVTTDETETMFAADLAPTLVAPICVEYHMVADLAARHRGMVVSLLWREAADHVGKVGELLGEYALDLIDDQHEAAQIAYRAIIGGKSEAMQRARISYWLEMCERMATQIKVPELRPLAAGLVEVYERQRIFFGDLHAGNLGMVTRNGKTSWVITDPGHVAVVDLA